MLGPRGVSHRWSLIKQFSHCCTRTEAEAERRPSSEAARSCLVEGTALPPLPHVAHASPLLHEGFGTQETFSCRSPLLPRAASIFCSKWGRALGDEPMCYRLGTSTRQEPDQSCPKLSPGLFPRRLIFLPIPVRPLLHLHLHKFPSILPSPHHLAMDIRTFLRPVAKSRLHFSPQRWKNTQHNLLTQHQFQHSKHGCCLSLNRMPKETVQKKKKKYFSFTVSVQSYGDTRANRKKCGKFLPQ